MSLSVNPVTSPYYPTPLDGEYSGSVTASTAAYDQIIALVAQENAAALAGTSSGSGSGTSDTNSLDSAVLLNLSPAALNILNGIDNATATGSTTTSGISATAGTTSTVTVGGTTFAVGQTPLTATQSAQVSAIVSSFASQPATAQTFAQIENAIAASGINPQLVSIQQILEGYNYAYAPGLAFEGDLFTDTLASELEDA